MLRRREGHGCRRPPPPHVGVNLAWLTPGAHGGLEVYARELVERLAVRADLRLTLFASREAFGEKWPAPTVCVPVSPAKRSRWIASEQVALPVLVAEAGCDLLHNPANTAPGLVPCPQITTIHDLHYKLVPDAFRFGRAQVMGGLTRLAAKRSARILTDSRATANDLTTYLRVDPRKIDVAWLGMDARRGATPAPPEDVRRRFGIGDRKVVLCVCAKRPSKNLARLIEAHGRLRPPRPVLLLVGNPEGFQSGLSAAARRWAVEDDVRFVDWVTDEDLEGLYNVAQVFAFPSLYEGFGLPPLEAMRRRVPVVASQRGSLAEVVGDAAVIIDPENVDDIATGVRRLLEDAELRRRMISAGLERAAGFTWSRTLDETVRSYFRVLPTST